MANTLNMGCLSKRNRNPDIKKNSGISTIKAQLAIGRDMVVWLITTRYMAKALAQSAIGILVVDTFIIYCSFLLRMAYSGKQCRL